jgi:superfamily II DNA or RNA helicase
MLISNTSQTMLESLIKSIENADEIIMNVSFIRDSGLKLLIPSLKKARDENKNIKILTSDYMGVTEPVALYRLMDIPNVKIFKNISKKSFHPKTYIFKKDKKVEVYIGSSNLSYSALVSGVEWNYNFKDVLESDSIKNILAEFDELYEKNSFLLTLEWLREYEKSYCKKDYEKIFDSSEEEKNEKIVKKKIEPIKFQISALYELARTREEGYKKALVIVGTGLGKTYLSAFDSMNFKKILFVAHRDEILQDAKKTFETVYGDTKTYGFFQVTKKENEADIVFASVATLSKKEYLCEQYFSVENFDYIVIDEFHHSAAMSYQNILSYFKPKFLLGLTATPDRMDSGDIYKICDYNIAYECDFRVGINNGWLVPFEYFGIYDETDYSQIPWRGTQYDLNALENSLIIEKNFEKIYQKYMEYKKNSTIVFCVSVKHCKTLNEYFKKRGIKSSVIVGETPKEERQAIIADFKAKKIDVIFTVDIFNEGVDIPCIDTILFLRPTCSYTIFIQQLGRGLRTYLGKEKLRVLDFVGNYRGAELRPSFLLGHYKNKKLISPIDSDFNLPSGCTANFDFKVIEYFEQCKTRNSQLQDRMKEEYSRIKEFLEKKPLLMDIYTFGEIPVHTYLQKYKSWYNFLKEMKDLSQQEVEFSEIAVKFLNFLEKTPMTKSYKMPLFLSLFQNKIRKSISLREIGIFYKEFYNDELHGKDLSHKKQEYWNEKNLEILARDNPIHFLTNNEKNKEFFSFDGNEFSLNDKIFEEIESNEVLLKHILDRLQYRNINYFKRKYMEE